MSDDITNKDKGIMKYVGLGIRVLIVSASLIMIYWYIDSRFIGFGNLAGILFFVIAAGCAIFYNYIKKFISKLRKRKGGKIAVNIVFVLIGLFIIYVVTALCLMFYGSGKAPEKGATVVVLGCEVRGETPSQALKNRLDAAYSYLTENPDSKAVLSGGQGDNENISEAECMYRYLTEMGISEDRLYKEDKSATTYENIKFSMEIIKNNKLSKDLAIVTDWYHEYRASLIAKRQGIENVGAVGAPTQTYLTANLVTREIFALGKELIFG